MSDLLVTLGIAVAALLLLAGLVYLAVRKMKLFRPERTTQQMRALPEEAVLAAARAQSVTGAPRLRETSAPAWAARKIELTKPMTTIGRSIDSDVVLVEDAASVAHCRIERNHGEFQVVDLGSKNKTWVNGAKVKMSPLRHGDQIRVGTTTFIFEMPVEGA